MYRVRGLTGLQVDKFPQLFDRKHVGVSGQLDFADLVLPAGSDCERDIHRGLVGRLFYNFGLGVSDLGFEVAVFKKDGEEILLGLKHEAAA